MWSMRSRTQVLAALLACVTLAALLFSPSGEPSELVQAEVHHSGLELFSRFSGKEPRDETGSQPGLGTRAGRAGAVTEASLRVANPITIMNEDVQQHSPPYHMGRAASVMTPTRIKLLQKLKALLKDSKQASSSKAANAFHKAHKALVTSNAPDGDLQKLAQVSQELAGVTLHTAGCGDGATVIPCDQMKGINSDWATLQRVDSMDKNLIADLQSATVVSPAYSSSLAMPTFPGAHTLFMRYLGLKAILKYLLFMPLRPY
jgi:hypothetical protein